MTAVLPSLVLALLCLRWAGAEVPVQPDFNAEKFAGTWHVVAAFSNCSDFLKMKDLMKVSTTTVSFTPEGDLALKVIWPVPDKCEKIEGLYQRTGQAGRYTVQGKRDLRVVETDYSFYAVMCEAVQGAHEFSVGLQLLSREKDVSPQLMEKFLELIPAMGMTKDTLAIMPKTDQCDKATR